MDLVTARQMRRMDHETIHTLGLPGIVLMERASLGATHAILEHFEHVDSVGIFCGNGNNGGDGFAIARMLSHLGVEAHVILLANPAALKGDAALNWKLVQNLELSVHDFHEVPEQELISKLFALPHCDVWCDAMVGTGLDRPLSGRFATTAQFLNDRTHVVAIDLPSGLDANTGQPLGEDVVQANLCVTFGYAKLGQAIHPGQEHCGTLRIIDIGIPRSIAERVGFAGTMITQQWIRARSFPRAQNAHKGSVGKVFLLAGSDAMSGAALLCARGALLGGAGLVTVGTTREVVPRVSVSVPEVMAAEVISEDFSDEHRRELQHQLDRANVVAMGPGLGSSETLCELLEHLLLDPRQPLILDADALNLVATHDLRQALRRGSIQRPIVLTPHPGEMARLAEVPLKDILEHPLQHAQDFAQVTQCIVVLKLARTIIAAPDGRVAINTTGNPGMASGGTGDALTGLLAAQLGERTDAFEAACVATWVHGAAGDLCRSRRGVHATTASGLLDSVGEVFARIEP